MTTTLYAFASQNNKKVLYLLEELEIDYALEPVNLLKGENQTPEFLAMHPLGKVPVLKEDGEALFESGAICRHLARKHDRLWPSELRAQALVDQWMTYLSLHPGRWLSRLFFEMVLKPMIGRQADLEVCDEAIGFLPKQLQIVETHLSTRPFFVGDAVTVADVFAFAYLEQIEALPKWPLEFPAIDAWVASFASRPAISRGRNTMQRLWKASSFTKE